MPQELRLKVLTPSQLEAYAERRGLNPVPITIRMEVPGIHWRPLDPSVLSLRQSAHANVLRSLVSAQKSLKPRTFATNLRTAKTGQGTKFVLSGRFSPNLPTARGFSTDLVGC